MADDAPARVQAEEVQRHESALDHLLTAATHEVNIALRGPGRGPVSAATIGHEFVEKLSWSEARRKAADFLDDPVGEALRQAVRKIGKRLHEIGGEKLMLDVCHRVAARDPSQQQRRTAIMDHRWDGIGKWIA